MKLSAMCDHFSRVLGLGEAEVETTARHLRAARLIRSGGRGPGGAEMETDDFINLFLGVCACRYAKNAPLIVPVLRNIPRISGPILDSSPSAFLSSGNETVSEFLYSMFRIASDLRGLESVYGDLGSLTLIFPLGYFSMQVDTNIAPGLKQQESEPNRRSVNLLYAPDSVAVMESHVERQGAPGQLRRQNVLINSTAPMDTLAKLARSFPE